MTKKGQEQDQLCWVVAGHFAERLSFSKSQSDVVTRGWWLLPCQSRSFLLKHPPTGAKPWVNVSICPAAQGMQWTQFWVAFRRGPWQCSGYKSCSRTQGRLVSHFSACISSALHHSRCFFSKVRCLKRAWNINGSGVPGTYLHKGLHLHGSSKPVGVGLAVFCCIPQTPAAMSFWWYI